MKYIYAAAVFIGFFPCAGQAQWQRQAIDTTADFRGLGAVSGDVAWVSGNNGTYGRTTDGGRTWKAGTVPGAEKLDFRDVEAFGPDTAYLLSAGLGEDARIYKTTDGGKTWALQFKNADREAFFDAIARNLLLGRFSLHECDPFLAVHGDLELQRVAGGGHGLDG